jgi:hypothetical protein
LLPDTGAVVSGNMFAIVERLLEEWSELSEVGSGQTFSAIAAAERALAAHFPASFKQYLLRWGHLSFGPTEYFGLGSEVNDVVSRTKRVRDGHGLPSQFIVLCDHDGDEYVCLDTSTMVGEECAVVIWEPSSLSINRQRATTFEEFLSTDMESFVD